jgi:hypothetical protein
MLGGPIHWPLEQAPQVLGLLRALAPDAPRRARGGDRRARSRRRCRSRWSNDTAPPVLGLLVVWPGGIADVMRAIGP